MCFWQLLIVIIQFHYFDIYIKKLLYLEREPKKLISIYILFT